MVLDHLVYAALSVGSVAAGSFLSGAGATAAADGTDVLIYNSTTGALYYDPDGTAAGAATQFATLTGTPALAATDFVVS